MTPQADVSGHALKVTLDGIHGKVAGLHVDSALTGRFNCYNILSALTVGKCLKIAPEAIERGISSLKLVPGRLERVSNQKGLSVLVDYAHKPDALENVLATLRDMKSHGQRIITVVGCGGDRDRKKRPVMGKLAVEMSDHVCITSDNPRTEDPQAIIREILAGVQGHSNYEVEPDRKQAIFKAILRAKRGDIVLIAGKGHENYQIIAAPGEPGGVRKIHFDDCEVAQEALAAL
jgi:UDP-N-acetylmuramoyl-L-alanyl-D-glutamate--2,6-diaminopimelate ligase